MGNQHAAVSKGTKGNDPLQKTTTNEAALRRGSPSSSIPVLPDESTEFFLSVAVIDGIEASERVDGVCDLSQSPSCAYWKSKDRERHLRWAAHRGIEHGCQPALFWRTPFVDESLWPQRTSDEAEQPLDSQSSACSLLTRYLSQFAYNFIFDANGASIEEFALRDKNKTKGKGEHAPKDSKRSILIYIVAADHLSDQVNVVTRMWEEAAAEMDGASVPPDAGFEVKVVPLHRSHFHENKIRIPPHSLEMDKDRSDNVERDICYNDEPTVVSVEQLAAVRGAGILYGYPALVFDCNPLLMSCICCDINGRILGIGVGSGLSVKLQKKCRDNNTHEIEKEHAGDRGEHYLEPAFDETRDQVKRALGDAADEISASTRSLISRWLYHLNCFQDDDDSVPADNEALVSGIATAIQEDRSLESKPPIVNALYERLNEKRHIVTCGGDSDLFAALIGSCKSGKSSNPNPTIGVPRFDGEDDKNKIHFPWADSAEALYPREEMSAAGAMDGCRSHPPPKFSSRAQRLAMIHNRHLSHYGIAASIMGNYIALNYQKQGGTSEPVDSHDQHTLVGRRVAKLFLPDTRTRKKNKGGAGPIAKGEIYRGCVAGVHSPTDDYRDEKEWFYIEYDDGDSEHVARKELNAMLELYAKVGEGGELNTMREATQDDATKPAATAQGNEAEPESSEKEDEQETSRKRRRPANYQYYFW